MTGVVMATRGCGGGGGKAKAAKEKEEEQNQMRLMEYLLAALRKSLVSCRVESGAEDVISAVHSMDIGWPTNVRHVTHVTFDRFNGFLGLPLELQVEIPGRVPSASASVFGVSAESMQCSYDTKGNSVPTILLLMQDRLYSQGGLKAEGIFRINPENSKEEEVRGQLNRGEVPEDIDVHCLAGLIKAWFRELPSGVLDGLSPDQVLECSSEDDCVGLLNHLGPTETALLNWAVDLMADIVMEEEFNKMNARNIAMVFAPNMTQMSDPLTALMHAVQVMNLLKTLITKTLAERKGGEGGSSPMSSSCSSDCRDDDEDLYSHHDMETGSEGNGQSSRHSSEYEDDDDHKDLYDHDHEDLYDHDHEDLYEVQVLGEIMESFSGKLDEEKPSANLEEEEEKCVTLQCCSEISLTDSHNVSSGLTSINEEEEEECIDSAISMVEDTNAIDSREEEDKAEEESSILIVEKTSGSEQVSHAPEELV